MSEQELIQHAQRGMEQAYAPYSNFRVGAALLAKSGNIYLGCNIENSSYGATNCAERTAIFKAVSEGEREFEAIAIVCSNGTKAYPCGICLQVMSEFLPEGKVILEDESGIQTYKVSELLPSAFRLDISESC
ncbi:MAG: cytidine deaminase [Lachnospiraceae bacterium]|nr:cytidine deaminase [Lachnospiraceae bacterium]